MKRPDLEKILDARSAAYRNGANDMLESIRSSLRDYPNAGGDIEVMREVERIVREAVRVAIEKERS